MRKLTRFAAAPLAAALIAVAAPAASASEADVIRCRDIFSDRICDIVEQSITIDPIRDLIEEIRCSLNPDCPW